VEATVLNLDRTFAEVLRRTLMSSRSASRSKARAAMRWWLGPVIAYLCMLVVLLLFPLLLGPFVGKDVLTAVEHFFAYGVPLAIVYLHVRRFERRKKFWQSVGVQRKKIGQCFIWVFALFAVFFVIEWVYWGAMGSGAPTEVDQYYENYFSDWYFAYAFFASFVLVGLSEELIFRGFTLDRFLVKGPIFAILASSLMFSSLHFWYVTEFGLTGLLLYGWLFMFAVYLGIVYWKTRNIIGLVVIHGLINFLLSVEHFFGAESAAAAKSMMFIVGVACLGYLLIKYIRGVFREIEVLVRGRGESREGTD